VLAVPKLYGLEKLFILHPGNCFITNRGAGREKMIPRCKRDYLLIGYRNRYWDRSLKNAITLNLLKNIKRIFNRRVFEFYKAHIFEERLFYIPNSTDEPYEVSHGCYENEPQSRKKRKHLLDYMESFFFKTFTRGSKMKVLFTVFQEYQESGFNKLWKRDGKRSWISHGLCSISSYAKKEGFFP